MLRPKMDPEFRRIIHFPSRSRENLGAHPNFNLSKCLQDTSKMGRASLKSDTIFHHFSCHFSPMPIWTQQVRHLRMESLEYLPRRLRRRTADASDELGLKGTGGWSPNINGWGAKTMVNTWVFSKYHLIKNNNVNKRYKKQNDLSFSHRHSLILIMLFTSTEVRHLRSQTNCFP